MTYYSYYESPFARLMLVSDGMALTGLHMGTPGRKPQHEAEWTHDPSIAPLRATTRQLDEYFAGKRRDFDLPLAPSGTPFQRRVWRGLTEIGFGETLSYGQLAKRIKNPKASRAVGLANGANPIAIVVPCHRVIGADGSLTGYGGGLERKRWLLAHEGVHQQH
jgi:methylated-DNA-[protein]-cysteine S-methyltransferase